jgi:hypothetical protein
MTTTNLIDILTETHLADEVVRVFGPTGAYTDVPIPEEILDALADDDTAPWIDFITATAKAHNINMISDTTLSDDPLPIRL